MNITFKATAIGCLFCFLLGIGAGFAATHYFMVHPLAIDLAKEQAKPPQVKETVRTDTVTKMQYVPGETVYVPVHGKPEPVATKLDGKFDIGKPNFIYTLNGKPGQFAKTDDEQYVFDKNMIALTQSSTIKIEAEIPTVDLTRRSAAGPYVTTESYGVMLSRETSAQRWLLLAGRKWDEKNGRGFEAGGAWQLKF